MSYKEKPYTGFQNYRINPESDLQEIIKVFFYILGRFEKICKLFFKEISFVINKERILSKKLISACSHDLFKACCTAYSIEKIVKENKIEGDLILYSYWFTHSALSTLLVKSNSKITLKRVCRAHGGDLYEERNKLNYLSFRRVLLNNLDHIYCISQHGKKYLLRKHGTQFQNKVSVQYLASPKPIHITYNKANPNSFVLVSCAFVSPVKRLDLTLASIQLLPDIPILWIHIGGGSNLKYIEAKAKKVVSSKKNLIIDFKGNLTADEIQKFYSNQYVDLFINNSQYEGLPVSMMEAQSFGIPIIGLNIGGVSDIVSNKTGILLPEDANAKEIAQAIERIIQLDVSAKNEMRLAALRQWEDKFNPDKNFSKFAAHMKQLLHANS